MRLLQERCTGCGYCVLVCPYDALTSNGWAELDPAKCTDCNLCVYACPSDCFRPEPDRPLKPYGARLKPEYDVVVIGSGLGGLMAAAALAQAGRRVAVFEKLGFPGGRYTELDYRGAAVTTGAWTNLGPRSHIGRFLAELDIELKYVSLADAGLAGQYSIRFPDGRRYAGLPDMLAPPVRRAWLKAIAQGRQALSRPETGPGLELDLISAVEYVSRFCTDPDLLALVNATAATASGVSGTRLPAGEYIQITLDSGAAGVDFAMPEGGVRAIIRALAGALRQAGGELFVRSPVAKILLKPGTGTGVDGAPFRAVGIQLADGRRVRSRVVIHNGGLGSFANLAGPAHLPPVYLNRLANLTGVECAALFCATREPLFTEAPITMTPGCQRVTGVFSPTVLDPTLSRRGLHLADAFFPLHSPDRTAELALALADMRALFPHFEKVLEWAVPMFFTGNWPGTESGQLPGQTGENRLDPQTPIERCFLVGMDLKGSGVAGDLIPLGVRRLLQQLERLE